MQACSDAASDAGSDAASDGPQHPDGGGGGAGEGVLGMMAIEVWRRESEREETVE